MANSLSERMKQYEFTAKSYLQRRTPVIIRIDGKAFHSFTKGFDEPFDDLLIETMNETMLYLCESIQGCVFGYCQSDEISLLLCDWQKIDTDAWFSYNVQKCATIASSIATFQFNRRFAYNKSYDDIPYDLIDDDDEIERLEKINFAHDLAIDKGALFKAYVFNVPKEEVVNYFIWRQQDCERNSIQMVVHTLYTTDQIKGIKNKELQNKMFTEKDVNWNDYPVGCKRGRTCFRIPNDTNTRKPFKIDEYPPIFTQDRQYIENLMTFDKNE